MQSRGTQSAVTPQIQVERAAVANHPGSDGLSQPFNPFAGKFFVGNTANVILTKNVGW
jgi:hypothetical protein